MATLYLASTPIGNLGDITLRALEIFKSVRVVAAEDTRVTRKLLSHYGIHCRLISYNEHSPPSRLDEILSVLQDQDVVYATDAGAPGISDPGMTLVATALEKGIKVTPLPGASALTTAIMGSGFPANRFLFLGFLPRGSKERAEALAQATTTPYTIVLFEAPHRLVKTLQDLLNALGDRQIVVAREMTKIHEEFRRSHISQEIEYWSKTEPRGEYTLVIAPSAALQEAGQDEQSLSVYLDRIEEGVRAGKKAKDIIKQIATQTGISRNLLYRAWLDHLQNINQDKKS
ncbi:Uroporphyrin-III C/tetrapyrrole (Corrin/Porphyrin) methyltransferase [Thermobaculum terrenum ATCC BAA-798]|uniref:Ribosomal RNA small subunit methyltransferase I n=1 Tax=Thermobaculum terrenum (strain ATCC BAA-798 / CCMEE 7001 / YNP1) TaxID=525904 RepID=D1CD79_THET1|nr:16S rRNA (cytidine(1402)-2'-O)-methyltransferase [Thermobaculum terrenum]ACZ42744.1 Uroporphyrin-III C/tetrapyrrole (Corrin/Porphyrin) methyltransferase [Thermobaculum terrenum ATCC BAA-798]